MKTISVSLAPPPPPRGGVRLAAAVPVETVAVVIDVLRATTTLTRALANGARGVVAVATPGEGFAARDRRPGALLCGERDGRRVEGFDLGNSPFEYGPEVVKGRTLVFASTNGSQALLAAAHRRRRVLACFANLGAAIGRVAGAPALEIFCAGKEGAFALEDAACAGAIVARLRPHGFAPANAEARMVERLAPRDAGEVRALVEGCAHARVLIDLGPEYARDVAWCASLDAIGEAFEV